MKLVIVLPNLEGHKFFIFSVYWINFCCDIFSNNFPIKLQNIQCYSIHVFYKGRLCKKNSIIAKKIQPTLIIKNSITKKKSRFEFGITLTYEVQFKNVQLDVLNNV